jgi:hypothetical protein
MSEERFLHELSAVTVLSRGIRSNLWDRRPRGRRVRETVLWHAVSEQFSLGSTYSKDLCRKAGIDPELKAWTWKAS